MEFVFVFTQLFTKQHFYWHKTPWIHVIDLVWPLLTLWNGSWSWKTSARILKHNKCLKGSTQLKQLNWTVSFSWVESLRHDCIGLKQSTTCSGPPRNWRRCLEINNSCDRVAWIPANQHPPSRSSDVMFCFILCIINIGRYYDLSFVLKSKQDASCLLLMMTSRRHRQRK
jgi:hypothetical protein